MKWQRLQDKQPRKGQLVTIKFHSTQFNVANYQTMVWGVDNDHVHTTKWYGYATWVGLPKNKN